MLLVKNNNSNLLYIIFMKSLLYIFEGVKLKHALVRIRACWFVVQSITKEPLTTEWLRTQLRTVQSQHRALIYDQSKLGGIPITESIQLHFKSINIVKNTPVLEDSKLSYYSTVMQSHLRLRAGGISKLQGSYWHWFKG